MVIIIEGLDGVGKTTTARGFVDKLKELYCDRKFYYVHESHSDDNEFKLIRKKTLRRLINSEDMFVYDRITCIDDFVYGFLNKVPSCLKYHKDEILDMLKECVIIHLTLDKEEHQKRFFDRGDEFINWSDMEKIENNYKEFYKDLNNVNYFELTLDNEKNIDELIRRFYDTNITHSQ